MLDDLPPDRGGTVEKQQNPIRIELTDEQRKQLKDASGEDFNVLEFQVQELETRIVPAYVKIGLHY